MKDRYIPFVFVFVAILSCIVGLKIGYEVHKKSDIDKVKIVDFRPFVDGRPEVVWSQDRENNVYSFFVGRRYVVEMRPIGEHDFYESLRYRLATNEQELIRLKRYLANLTGG